MDKPKKYIVLIAAFAYAHDDAEACAIADKYVEHMKGMAGYEDNRAGLFRITDTSPKDIKNWRRIVG